MRVMIDLKHVARGGRILVVIGGLAFALFGILFLLISFGAIRLPAGIAFPPAAIAVFGSIFILVGAWVAFEGVTNSWGRDSILYQWMNLGLTIVLVLGFATFWFVLWLEIGAGQPGAVLSGTAVGVLCGGLVLMLLIHTIIRVRLLCKKPVQEQGQADEAEGE